MKRNMLLLAGMLCMGGVGYSQTPYINEDLLSPDLSGSARYVGMGGALGALGADMSAVSSNPAGIGLFRKSDVSLTFGVRTQKEKPDVNADMTQASFDQMGFVFTTPVMGSTVKFVNFAFNYQKKASFNNAFIADNPNLNGLSQTQQMADLYNNNLASPLADLMFSSYLIDPVDKDGNIVSGLDDNVAGYIGYDGWNNQFSRVTEGSLSAFDFNLSTNLSDRVYLGLTVGVDRVDYTSYTTYSEQMQGVDNVTGSLVPLGMWYSAYDCHSIRGYGINAKFGAIFRPIESSAFRIGVTVETPTRYDLESAVSYSIDSPYNQDGGIDYDKAGNIQYYNYSPDKELANLYYTLSTPWKFRVSAGHTIGNYLALGAEYEYANYTKMRQSYDDGYGSFNGVRDGDMKDLNKSVFKGVHSFKFGFELNLIEGLNLRAGYNFYSSAFAKNAHLDQVNASPAFNYQTTTDYMNKDQVNIYTVGLGYRFRHFYLDAAYKYRQQTGDFYAFDDTYSSISGGERLTPVNVDLSNHQVFFTLGYKF